MMKQRPMAKSARPEPKDDAARQTMRANRSKNTGLELALRKALWRAGLRGYRLHPKGIIGKPDIYLGRAGLCIFVHGCFWHGCETCQRNLTPKHNATYWSEKVARNRARDAKVLKELRDRGYETIVIWECEIKRDIEAVVKGVLTETARLSTK